MIKLLNFRSIFQSEKSFFTFCLVAFAESSIFPLPPDLFMIPMGVNNRDCVWRLAFWGTFWSVIGGFVGYAIGALFFEAIGSWVINTYHLQDAFARFQQSFQDYGFWLIALKGLTPIPFKLVTIASGLTKLNLGLFFVACVIARATRFYMLAAFLWWCGPKAKDYLEKYMTLTLIGITLVLISGFFLIKWIL